MTAPSAYAVAIDTTRQTLIERSASYRNLVVAVVSICIASASLALGLRRSWPLSIATALPAAVLTFVWLDSVLLTRWRTSILRAWSADVLRLDLLSTTLRQVPGLPLATLAGMLAALPTALEIAVPMAARRVAVQAQEAVAAAGNRRMLGRAVCLWIGAGVLVVAATMGSVVALSGLVLPIVAITVWLAGIRLRLRHELRTASAAMADVNCGGADWIASLDWQGVPLAMQRAVIPA